MPRLNKTSRGESDDNMESEGSGQGKSTAQDIEDSAQILKEDQQFHQNICFGQLGYVEYDSYMIYFSKLF